MKAKRSRIHSSITAQRAMPSRSSTLSPRLAVAAVAPPYNNYLFMCVRCARICVRTSGQYTSGYTMPDAFDAHTTFDYSSVFCRARVSASALSLLICFRRTTEHKKQVLSPQTHDIVWTKVVQNKYSNKLVAIVVWP